MDAKTKIKTACAAAGMSMADFADKMNISPQTLSQRARTGKFTLDEWEAMAAALGCRWVGQFVFDDGTTI